MEPLEKVASETVLHLVRSLEFGGVESRMRIISACPGGGRFRHTFCAITRGGATARDLVASGARVDVLGFPSRVPHVMTIVRLYWYLRKARPSVLHCHGAEANFHGLVAGYLARVPVRVGEEIGIPSHSAIARVIFRLIYLAADSIVAISDAVRAWLADNYEVPLEKSVRIYNPVQIPTTSLSSPPSDTIRIGYVGRLEPVKNPLVLIEAVSALASEGLGCELWIVGDGSLRPALEEAIVEKRLKNCIKLWGYQANPGPLLRQCHIYVQPSLSEGFGLALVEAMGCGLPVIATNVGGAPELIDEGRTGWLVAPNVTSIVGKLRTAMALGPRALAEIGAAARASTLNRFGAERYVNQLECLYSELSQKSRHGGVFRSIFGRRTARALWWRWWRSEE